VESRAVRAVERERVLGLRLGLSLETEQTLFWTDLEIASLERRDLRLSRHARLSRGLCAGHARGSRQRRSFARVTMWT